MTLKEWAFLYAENGFPVFPLKPKAKEPFKGSSGCLDATTDLKIIESWWGECPDANIGMPMGEISGLCGIDFDRKDGADEKFLDGIPATYCTQTPGGIGLLGGLHLLFRFHPLAKNAKKVQQGITIRSTGYYFVMPGSIHPSTGTPYLPVNGTTLWKAEIAELPEWIANCADHKKEKPRSGKWGIGDRHEALKNLIVALRKCGKSKEEIRNSAYRYNKCFLVEPKEEKEIDALISWVFQKAEIDPEASFKESVKEEIKLILDSQFIRFVDKDKSFLYYVNDKEKKQVDVVVNKDFIVDRIRVGCSENNLPLPSPLIINKTIIRWKNEAVPFDTEPESFLWLNEPGWTFHRLPFSPSAGDFTAWDSFTNRLSAPEIFKAFVWSIFEKRNRSRQFLYLFDPNGQGGKTTVFNILAELMGKAFAALNNQNTSKDSVRWLMSTLYGKRLVIWPDCKNPNFPMSELVRNITSGDPVSVEAKGEAPFTASMYLKLMIGSNLAPAISKMGADTSRLIRIEVAPNLSKDDGYVWKEHLKEQLPGFLFDCQRAYAALCPNHLDIIIDDVTRGLVSDSSIDVESKFEEIADRRLVFGPELEMSNQDWRRVCEEERLNNYEIRDFKAFLERDYPGVAIKRAWVPSLKKNRLHCFGFKYVTFGVT